MQYEIKGGSFPVVICQLQSGEKMITEKGAMVWMSPNMEMETVGGGLGKMAINYGYYNFKFIVMWAAVIGLIILVQLFQSLGTRLANRCDKRLRKKN